MRHVKPIALLLIGFGLCLFQVTQSLADDLIEASKVRNRQVLLEGGEQAEISDMLFDPQTGVIGVAVLSKGGLFGLMEEEYVVPWQALDVGEDGRFRLAPGVVLREKPQVMSLDQVDALYRAAKLDNVVARARAAVKAEACGARWSCDQLLELDRAMFFRVRLADEEQDLGRISDVLIDPEGGQVALLVMEKGVYFFRWVEVAVSNDRVLLPWPSLVPMQGADVLLLTADSDAFDEVAVFTPQEQLSVGLDRVAAIYAHFGQEKYWKTLREVLR